MRWRDCLNEISIHFVCHFIFQSVPRSCATSTLLTQKAQEQERMSQKSLMELLRQKHLIYPFESCAFNYTYVTVNQEMLRNGKMKIFFTKRQPPLYSAFQSNVDRKSVNQETHIKRTMSKQMAWVTLITNGYTDVYTFTLY